jgi:xylulose-5-phosphate/fructose-6-phosphate phosphoketolase
VEATRVLGTFLRDVMAQNADRFRVFSPDENNSNRLQDILQVTDRTWNAETYDDDDHLARDGRVMEILSEHTCQGWLEGYLLTGRHGFLLLLRGLRAHRRLDVQPARQVDGDQ